VHAAVRKIAAVYENQLPRSNFDCSDDAHLLSFCKYCNVNKPDQLPLPAARVQAYGRAYAAVLAGAISLTTLID